MFIKLNKITLYVNFIKRKYKKRICNYTHYTHRGICLHLKQKNLIYHSTGKNITGKFFNQYKKEKYEM